MFFNPELKNLQLFYAALIKLYSMNNSTSLLIETLPKDIIQINGDFDE